MWIQLPIIAVFASCALACSDVSRQEPTLVKPELANLRLGERVPNTAEALVVGAPGGPLSRGSPRFARLVRCEDRRIVFKDEEKTDADRMMTPRLRARLVRLAELVRRRWPSLTLRVTEAWDENHEHGENSVHYEGRAADVTTSDMDPQKLGHLARLAVDAELDWVFYENTSHVHVSVKR